MLPTSTAESPHSAIGDSAEKQGSRLDVPLDETLRRLKTARTGGTVGKGTVRILGRGPLKLTLVERATRRAVRVAPRASATLAGLADEEAATRSRRLLHVPEKRSLSVSAEFRYGRRPRSPRGGERRGIDRGQGRPEARSLGSKP